MPVGSCISAPVSSYSGTQAEEAVCYLWQRERVRQLTETHNGSQTSAQSSCMLPPIIDHWLRQATCWA